MRAETSPDWPADTLAQLAAAGYRSSVPRAEIIKALGDLGCSVSAQELIDELQRRGRAPGPASVYRTLELLNRLGMVHRVDVGEGASRYEPALPGGDHHHHLVCDRCGEVEPFEDEGLEKAIGLISRRLDFDVSAHDVTLRGECPSCHARA